ncbi:Ditrans,polycis-undecaprenyl-diphosphate synthase ((2E,6E)-farnesyl-diphosphate specific) [Anaerohalosphaera lusitana]|uniref:Isoprenyl transferase n=1 Tax=Anaerohalosphaera lusitana TaxID=1936003 RepID=A0A1U9NI55_9BACT|nr:isoprenyl transferase [Anaerohalosphaera lusitana]AQT67622.1 Ditrans,polycis-undecaprenyl-diphosphate synthase ((2E,6E)-farnesyl-diphosphate specific) [Anaerohalosphaera lusitana]
MTDSFKQKRAAAAERLGVPAESIPRHIAIIMDGNGRWAQQRGLPRFHGHSKGGQIVEKIALYCVDIGVEALTLYSFSMQNWKRPAEEIEFLMGLYSMYLEGIRETLMKNDVRLVHLGREKPLPDKVIETMHGTVDLTKNNKGMALGLALNYGARTELIDAAREIAEEYKAGKLDIDDIDESCFDRHLYTAGLPDPDLLIRTSGEMRISNFLLWQLSYAEFYVTETFWPDFNPDSLDEAILAYAKRARRFGDVNSKSAQQ